MTQTDFEDKTMAPEFHTVTYDDLKPVLDALIALPHKPTTSDFQVVVESLGWSLYAPRRGTTTLPVNLKLLSGGFMDRPAGNRELVSVNFRVSDTFMEPVPQSAPAALDHAFNELVSVVTACLERPPDRERPWGLPGRTWDLPQGGQIDLLRGNQSIILVYKGRTLQALEMADIRDGQPIDAGL